MDWLYVTVFAIIAVYSVITFFFTPWDKAHMDQMVLAVLCSICSISLICKLV